MSKFKSSSSFFHLAFVKDTRGDFDRVDEATVVLGDGRDRVERDDEVL